MKKACCGFGHRNVFENISDKLDQAIESAIQQGCEIFYTGAMGEFDSLFSSVVRKAKKSRPHIRLICVKPYFTNDINIDRDYYNTMYDDVIIPPELIGVHYKAAIKARNRWMIDNSDIVLVYTMRNYGGAYDALKYAERKNKYIIKI
ncbi:MAG: DUF1273 family protein [Clostridia bacterium]|nr:DUF1273 family protein [Ruminococcus sp.]MBR0088611.1 DUF1273 family protein [Clostridia bacterium]